MSVIGEAVLKVTGDMGGAVSELRTLKDAVNQTGQATTQATSGMMGSLAALGTSLGFTKQKFSEAGQAITSFDKVMIGASVGIIAFLKESASAWGAQEDATARLTQGLHNMGQASQQNIQALSDQATALEKVTRFSDESITSAQGQMTTFRLSADTIKQITPSLLDMAEGLRGVDGATLSLDDGAKLMGKALGGAQDGIDGLDTALRRNGVIMTDAQKSVLKFGTEAQRANTIVGIMNQNFGGFAQAGGKTFNGQMAQVGNIVNNFMETIGQLLAQYFAPLIAAFKTWSDTVDQAQLAQKIIAVAGAILGFTLVLTALITIMKVVMLLTNPFILIFTILAAIFGYNLYKALSSVQTKMADTGNTAKKSFTDIGSGAAAANKQVNQLSDDTVKKLQDLDDQFSKTTRDYLQNLKDMIQGKKDEVTDLKSQIADETKAFQDANSDRTKSFNQSMADIESSHSKKVAQIEQDLALEVLKGSKADQQRIVDLNASLAEENTSYQQSKDTTVQKYQDETASALAEHTKQTDALQVKLNADMDLLSKHEADVAAVQNVATLDEIDNLKQRYSDAKTQYEKDKADAIAADSAKTGALIANSGAVGTAGVAAFGDIGKSITDMANGAVGSFGNIGGAIDSLMSKLNDLLHPIQSLKDAYAGLQGSLNSGVQQDADIMNLATAELNKNGVTDKFRKYVKIIHDNPAQGDTPAFLNALAQYSKLAGYASGVQNAPGGWSWVGEKGPELMNVPQGANIYPADQSRGMMGGDVHITFTGNITNTDNRTLDEIANRLGQQLILRRNGAF